MNSIKKKIESKFIFSNEKTLRQEPESEFYILMVPGTGLEPVRYRYRGILSPLRLPISPPGQV